MNRLFQYLSTTCRASIDSWNQFWFSPSSTLASGLVRVCFGLWGLVFLASWFNELPRLIGPIGMMDSELTRYLIGYSVEGTGSGGRISLLYWLNSPAFVQAYLIVAMVASTLMVLGLGGRWMAFIAWILVLGVVHRLPMLQGPGELLVVGMFGYLVVDTGKEGRFLRFGLHDRSARTSANFAVRLAQVHFVLWMSVAFLTHFAETMWWDGSALWSLAMADRTVWWHRDSLVDHPYLVNLVSHAYLMIFGLVLILLCRTGTRLLAVGLGFALAIVSYGMCGDWIYALAIIGGLSSFAGEAHREWVGTEPTEVAEDIECEPLKMRNGRAGRRSGVRVR